MRTNKRIKVLTNAGYKYDGELISQDDTFIEINDIRQGKIKIPLVNISLVKEVEE